MDLDLIEFKMEALQRLTRIETKVEKMELYDEELHDDILALRGFVLDAEKAIDEDLQKMKDLMPNTKTYQIMFGVFSTALVIISSAAIWLLK